MARDLGSATLAELRASVSHVAHFAQFDYQGDPAYCWDGIGDAVIASDASDDAVFNGKTYVGLGQLGGFDSVKENASGGAPTTFTLQGVNGLDSPLKALVVDGRAFLGRMAYLWVCFMSADFGVIVGEPIRLLGQPMTGAVWEADDGDSILEITADRDQESDQYAPVYIADHGERQTGDKWGEAMVRLSRAPSGQSAAAILGQLRPPAAYRPPFGLPNFGGF